MYSRLHGDVVQLLKSEAHPTHNKSDLSHPDLYANVISAHKHTTLKGITVQVQEANVYLFSSFAVCVCFLHKLFFWQLVLLIDAIITVDNRFL